MLFLFLAFSLSLILVLTHCLVDETLGLWTMHQGSLQGLEYRQRPATTQTTSNKVYLYGGFQNGVITDEIVECDFISETCRVLIPATLSINKSPTPMPTLQVGCRIGASIAIGEITESLYLFGGAYSCHGPTYQDCDFLTNLWTAYDAVLNTWTWIAGGFAPNDHSVITVETWPSARAGSSLFFSDPTTLVLFGGYGFGISSNTPSPLNEMWSLDTESRKFVRREVVNPSTWPSARVDATTYTKGEATYLYGGQGLSDLWKYQDDSWTRLSTKVALSGTTPTITSTTNFFILSAGDAPVVMADSQWQFFSVPSSLLHESLVATTVNDVYTVMVYGGGVHQLWTTNLPPYFCDGVMPISLACGSHGECTGQDKCACEYGWGGAACDETWTCFGIPQDDSLVCGGNGRCLTQDACDCDVGYGGVGCYSFCNGIRSDDPSVCGYNGRCVDHDVCECLREYEGQYCDCWLCSQRNTIYPEAGQFRWLYGTNVSNSGGLRASAGFSVGNEPGARFGVASAFDPESDRSYYYGGVGLPITSATIGTLSDLWTFDYSQEEMQLENEAFPSAFLPNFLGEWATPPLHPNALRHAAMTFRNETQSLYLFGGNAPLSPGDAILCQLRSSTWPIKLADCPWVWNALWEWNLTSKAWRWVAGTQAPNQIAGAYPSSRMGMILGTSNLPGDANLIMFGGLAVHSTFPGTVNDVWSIDAITGNATQIRGSSVPGNMPAWLANVLLVPADTYHPGNEPGHRYLHTMIYFERDDTYLMYGGADGFMGFIYNDVWEFSSTTGEWRFRGGDATWNYLSDSPVIGSPGVYNPSFLPKGRFAHALVIMQDSLLIYGGVWFNDPATNHQCSDLWEFALTGPHRNEFRLRTGDPFCGSATETPVFGTKGVFDPTVTPGALFTVVSSSPIHYSLLFSFGNVGSALTTYNGVFEYRFTAFCDGFINNGSACSGHGDCMSEDVCICDPGYNQTFCDLFFCFGVNYLLPSACGGDGGICTGPDTCDCDPGYSGLACEEWTCDGVLFNSSESCNGSGVCLAPDTCDCDNGYYDDFCELWDCAEKQTIDPGVCDGHGACVAPEVCVCEPGYIDFDCEDWLCDGISHLSNQACGGHGDCVSPGVCECDPGYAVEDFCTTWTCHGFPCHSAGNCTNVPAVDPGSCFGNGECVAPNQCSCGYLNGQVAGAQELPFWKEQTHCSVCMEKSPILLWDNLNADPNDRWVGRSTWWQLTPPDDDLFEQTPLAWDGAFHRLNFGDAAFHKIVSSSAGLLVYNSNPNMFTYSAGAKFRLRFGFESIPDSMFLLRAHFTIGYKTMVLVTTITHFADGGISNVRLSYSFSHLISGLTCTSPSGEIDMGFTQIVVPVGGASVEVESPLMWFFWRKIDPWTEELYINGELEDTCIATTPRLLYVSPEHNTAVDAFDATTKTRHYVELVYFHVNNRTVEIEEVINTESAGTMRTDFAPYTCFGKLCSDEDCVCSGNGYCLWQDHCECFDNYIGAECDTLNINGCQGIPATDPDVCSGHGDCVGNDECLCEIGWDGPFCDQYISCGRECGDNGHCIEDEFFWNDGFERCVCETGWSGPWCTLYIDCNTTHVDNCFHWIPDVYYPLREDGAESVGNVYWRNLPFTPPSPDLDNLGFGESGVFINAPPSGGGVFDLVTVTTTPGSLFGISFWVRGVAPNLPFAHFTFGGSIGVGTDVKYTNDETTGVSVSVGDGTYNTPWVSANTTEWVHIFVHGVIGSPQSAVYVNGLPATSVVAATVDILVGGGIMTVTDIQAAYNITSLSYWTVPISPAVALATYNEGPYSFIFDSLYLVGTTPMCFDRLCDAVDICSGRGVCELDDVCSCCQGFEGEDCDLFAESCPVCLNCSRDCGDHGDCTTDPVGDERCVCDEDWSGDNCSVIIDNCVNGTIFNETLWSCVMPVCFGVMANQTGVCGHRIIGPHGLCISGQSNGRCIGTDLCDCFCGYKEEKCICDMTYEEMEECLPYS